MSDLTIIERLEDVRGKLYEGDTEAPHTYMQRLGNELNEVIKDSIEQSSNRDKKRGGKKDRDLLEEIQDTLERELSLVGRKGLFRDMIIESLVDTLRKHLNK